MEYDVKFTPAPDLPLLEGEVGEIYLDFDALYQISDPPVKTDIEAKPDPVQVIDQGDQEAAALPNPDERQPDVNLPEQSESLEQPVPNASTVKAPVRRPWYQAYHDASNIIYRVPTQKPR